MGFVGGKLFPYVLLLTQILSQTKLKEELSTGLRVNQPVSYSFSRITASSILFFFKAFINSRIMESLDFLVSTHSAVFAQSV